MKIAVSSRGQSLQDRLEPSFGRCAGFVVFDTNTQAISFLDNSRQQELAQGAGIQAAQMVSRAGIDVLISGRIGPKALQALSQSRIRIFAGSDTTVEEAIEAWRRNELAHISAETGQPGAVQEKDKGRGGRGRGPGQGGQGMGGGARGKGPGKGGRGKGGGQRGGAGKA